MDSFTEFNKVPSTLTSCSLAIVDDAVATCLQFSGQIGLGVGSWTSNITNAGSIPGEFD